MVEGQQVGRKEKERIGPMIFQRWWNRFFSKRKNAVEQTPSLILECLIPDFKDRQQITPRQVRAIGTAGLFLKVQIIGSTGVTLVSASQAMDAGHYWRLWSYLSGKPIIEWEDETTSKGK